jgi:hypothetical protein
MCACFVLLHRRTWVNEPKKAAAQVELLTRDADAPEEASGATALGAALILCLNIAYVWASPNMEDECYHCWKLAFTAAPCKTYPT